MTRRYSAAWAGVLACATLVVAPNAPTSAAVGVPFTASQAQVWVAGRQIAFAHLAIAYGDPVAPVDDPGMQTMLAAVAARSSWQPGTRFVAITRADGKLVTFTVGSNAVAVDGAPASMPFAPFSSGSDLYLPLLPLARALDLGVRGFHAGYVFVPQIAAVTPIYDGRRMIVRISASAPLSWHSALQGARGHQQLTLAFDGFGTDATGVHPIRSTVASAARVEESGPPGYPTTTVTISLKPGAMYQAHRSGSGAAVDVVLARDQALLRAAPASTPSSVHVAVTPLATAPPRDIRTTPSPTATPEPVSTSTEMPSPQSSASGAAGVPTAEPLGPGASPQASGQPSPAGSPSPAMQEQKITDVSVAQTPDGTRITLTLTGPVNFEWHRLADPDNRYWLDIDDAMLVGPAQTLTSKLAFIKEIKVSQHLLVPDKVVRVSIQPSQAIDVRVGTIVGSPNQLGIEIESQPPSPDAPTAGTGTTIGAAGPSPSASPNTPAPAAPMKSNLIVIDPGHGGSDPGSLNTEYGLTESNLTLAISRRLASDLKHQGWQVELTRDGDYDVGDPKGPDAQELQARCDVANAAGARMFVSVHINSSVSSAPNGATTYYWHPQDRAFAESVQNDMVAAMGVTDDGVIRNNFYVIHHTVMPSILVEVAYLSNPHDATLLAQSAFLDKIAAGIARGIGDFTGGPLAPLGQSSGSRPSHLRAPAGPRR